MKLPAKFNPKSLFRSKKTSTVSRSESSSFDSSITTSSDSPDSSHHHHRKSKANGGVATPTSVLRETSSSDEGSEISAELQFELLQAFRIMDGDGRITRSELEALLSRLGGAEPISPEELSVMINEIDRDGDGSISLEEFGVISSAFGPPSCDDEIRGAFEFFDTDNDGLITAGELFAVFKSIGDGECTLEDCRRMISSVDKNGDGFVCFEDFTRMMETQTNIL
ncbi:hypothetical protein SSX86_013365 [Deinandra increscens subsp. villosa]|uniref:EF-hand domain-containing protein n=1 Tax=Deinandra increscens subsp. villosa TaxID=3103831 RepID=A0AAP0DDH8_9ASTR